MRWQTETGRRRVPEAAAQVLIGTQQPDVEVPRFPSDALVAATQPGSRRGSNAAAAAAAHTSEEQVELHDLEEGPCAAGTGTHSSSCLGLGETDSSLGAASLAQHASSGGLFSFFRQTLKTL